MMTQPSYAPASFTVSVIGSDFMVPYPLEVRVLTNSSGDHLITDVNHKIMLKVKPCNTDYHEQRVLLDVNDRPIVMLREKIISAHSRWNIFRGDSKADSDMIFSTKTPKIFQAKTNVHVFLANKTSSKDACDFKITGSWSKRNCAIYVGDSSMTIAQMQKTEPTENIRFIKDKFKVTINPNVDYAFVIALIVIVEAMKSSNMDDEVVEEVIGDVAKVIGTTFS